MKQLLLSLLFLFSISFSQASEGYEALEVKDAITIKYKWKKNEEGKPILYLKYKNKSGKSQQINAEVGFYNNGIMQESATLKHCVKSGFFANLFAKPLAITPEASMQTTETEVQIAQWNTEAVESCE